MAEVRIAWKIIQYISRTSECIHMCKSRRVSPSNIWHFCNAELECMITCCKAFMIARFNVWSECKSIRGRTFSWNRCRVQSTRLHFSIWFPPFLCCITHPNQKPMGSINLRDSCKRKSQCFTTSEILRSNQLVPKNHAMVDVTEKSHLLIWCSLWSPSDSSSPPLHD